jgi:hypothetical protein
MRQILYILVGLFLTTKVNCQSNYIDPTGTYELDSKTEKKGEDIFGYFGKIQVKKIKQDKIVMTFTICKGAPSYNSGSFVDTLDYNKNIVIYKTPDFDPSCQIKFDFTDKGIVVKESTNDFNSGCGFGHAVVADGFFKKISSSEPLLKDPMTGEDIH